MFSISVLVVLISSFFIQLNQLYGYNYQANFISKSKIFAETARRRRIGDIIEMPSPTSGYGYEEDDATALQHWLTESRSKEEELSEEEKRNRRLIPLDSRSVINPHVAIHDRDVQLLERERALVKIITPEIVPNDDERNNKISYSASSS